MLAAELAAFPVAAVVVVVVVVVTGVTLAVAVMEMIA